MLDLLRRELGPHAVFLATQEWSVAARPPIAVLQPEHVDQVAAVLGVCTQEGIAVEAAGAGTWLSRGPAYDRDYLVLSTARMNDVIEYEPEDLTLGVQAGMPLHRLQQLVATNGQTIALDPPGHRDATIGAVAALASAGPLRCGYGTPRDQVLGLDAVTGDGRVLQVGGRVVKNVAGYDVTRLLVGSRGTLAVLTRVNLRLRPLPQHDVTWTIPADEPAQLLDLADTLYEAPLEPAAVELLRDGKGWQLAVRVHGNGEAIAHSRSVLTGAGAGVTELSAKHAQQFWQQLLDAEAAAPLYLRVSHLRTELPELVKRAAELLSLSQKRGTAEQGSLGANTRILVHVNDGMVRLCVDAAANGDRDANTLAARLRAFRDAVIGIGATVLVPALPTEMDGALPRHSPIGDELRLMQGVKRVLDPAGVLGPGRFVL